MSSASDSPIVDEVRQRAMRISERFGHDARKYLAHLRAIQEREKDRVVSQRTVVPARPQSTSRPPKP